MSLFDLSTVLPTATHFCKENSTRQGAEHYGAECCRKQVPQMYQRGIHTAFTASADVGKRFNTNLWLNP